MGASVGGRRVMPAHARLLSWLLVSLVVFLASAAPAVRAEPQWLERRTEYLVLRFTPTDEAEVGWYGAFVEDVYRHVSDIFGDQPRPGVVVTFYPDEGAYAEANPLAGREDGVLAHARPLTREIGLALSRLRKQPEGLRRDAVRHELTHIVLGELSDNKLSIGFHEGLAQFLEQDGEQRAKLVRLLRRGAEAGQLLTFAELNRQRSFLARAGVAYPQSYAVVHFLSERYGFGHLVRMVRFLPTEQGLGEAIQRAFGRSLEELEAEWRASLPTFLDGGWQRNALDDWDMTEPRQQLAEGKYAEARDGFERAVRLFGDLGRPERLERARAYLQQSTHALEAIEVNRRGSVALDDRDYTAAAELLSQAETLWSSVGDAGRHQVARTDLELARRGLSAAERLALARAQIESWRFLEARASALEAGTVFVELGDGPRTEEANVVLEEAQALQTRLGMAAVGGGAVGLTAIGLAWTFGRRPRGAGHTPRRMPPALAAREQDWSL